jgi:hypothetical protein
VGYRDALLEVSNAQAVTATAVSTGSIDLGPPAAVAVVREVGTGEPIGFAVSIVAPANMGTGDETYEFDIISSATANLAAPTVIASFVRGGAGLVAGALLFLPLPMGHPLLEFLGLRYTTGGTAPSMTVTAWLTPQSMLSEPIVIYPENIPGG